MNINTLRPWLGGLLCATWLLTSSGVAAQNTAQEKQLELAWKAAKPSAQMGPTTVKLNDQATLQLPANEAFIPQPAADRIMKAMGNGTDERMVGLIVPTSDKDNWMVVANYEPSGYIRDSDAKDWDVDALFKSLKEGTEEANKEREKHGITGLDIVGWVEKPHYEAATHRLIWSMAAREKGAAANQAQTINYNTYALGREGYISLNLLTDTQSVDNDKPAVHKLLSNLEFIDGKRYADFNSKTDKVAEYGLAALVAGVAAKKLGMFAIIAAFAAKFFKIIAVAVIGVFYGIVKLFKRKPKEAAAE